MQIQHSPAIDARYWTGITLASVFGTNSGDFYAHETGLGLLGGLPFLIGFFLVVYLLERRERLTHEIYYWLCIIIMRTGATNIADYLAGRRGLHIDRIVLTLSLGLILALLAWWMARGVGRDDPERVRLPDTAYRYWIAMLVAGVFGTVLGDLFESLVGDLAAALGLSVCLAVAIALFWRGAMPFIYAYWTTIATARTTGTAIGDWLAENKVVNIGLPLSTLLTGIAFVAVLVFWRPRRSSRAYA